MPEAQLIEVSRAESGSSEPHDYSGGLDWRSSGEVPWQNSGTRFASMQHAGEYRDLQEVRL